MQSIITGTCENPLMTSLSIYEYFGRPYYHNSTRSSKGKYITSLTVRLPERRAIKFKLIMSDIEGYYPPMDSLDFITRIEHTLNLCNPEEYAASYESSEEE